MNKHIYAFASSDCANWLPSRAIVFANYCLIGFIYFDSLLLPGFLKKILYLKFCRLLVESVVRNKGKATTLKLQFANEFIKRLGRTCAFGDKSKRIQINGEDSPWSTTFPGCPLFVDQAVGREISAFLSDQLSINNFWSNVLMLQPRFDTFFTCTHDIIFSPSHATRIHKFYCEGSNFLSHLIRKMAAFACDFNSFILMHQLHIHALAMSILSEEHLGAEAAKLYLKKVEIYQTTGFGIGDIITNYQALDYYVPQVIEEHSRNRQDLKTLLGSWWDNSGLGAASKLTRCNYNEHI